VTAPALTWGNVVLGGARAAVLSQVPRGVCGGSALAFATGERACERASSLGGLWILSSCVQLLLGLPGNLQRAAFAGQRRAGGLDQGLDAVSSPICTSCSLCSACQSGAGHG
jgi:hypothetical protein